MKKEKGQVSIETLLLASIIIMLSISVLGYYIRIMNPTMALETIEIETLKQIDAEEGQYFIKAIEYKADSSTSPFVIYFCIMLEPDDSTDFLNTDDMEDIVEESTGYEPETVSITQNDSTYCS